MADEMTQNSQRRQHLATTTLLLALALSCLSLLLAPPCPVAGLELTLSSVGVGGEFTLLDDRASPSASWAWTGNPTWTKDFPYGLTADGVTFAGTSLTLEPSAVAEVEFASLPEALQPFIAQRGYNSTAGDTVSVLSANRTDGQAHVWVLKERLTRPAVVFASATFVCDATVPSAFDSSFLCRSLGPVWHASGPYMWTANFTSALLHGGHDYPAESAAAVVHISITTDSLDPTSSVPDRTTDGFVDQLLAIAYAKCSESMRMNADIVQMYAQDSDRRSSARIAVAFLWSFITLTCAFAVAVVAVWIPWAIPYARGALTSAYSIVAIYLALAGIFVGVGLAEGLAGFVFLVVIVLLAIATINIVYCCVRARHRTESTAKVTPVTDSLAESTQLQHGGDLDPPAGAGHGSKYLQHAAAAGEFEEESLVPAGSPTAEGGALLMTTTTGDRPAYTQYPAPLGHRQRTLIGWSAMLFLVCAVTSVAIFGLWDCAEYLVWDRQSSRPLGEFMPQAIAKATLLVYAYDGFADRIRMNHLFFDVSTQWCGAHYSTRLTTEAQKYTSLYLAFISKYSIDMAQYQPEDYRNYTSVNQWFIRSLAPGVRPIAALQDESVVIQPCDARVMAFQSVPQDARVWIKDGAYSIETLIDPSVYRANRDNTTMASSRYEGGSMALVRLAPQDYHQFHTPLSGRVTRILRVEGGFHSVNADAIQSGNYAIYNQRTVVVIDTAGHADIGEVAYVAIGALCVGSITVTADVGSVVAKGQPLGYFQFGGSTIALVFERDRVQFDEDILQHSRQKVETLVQMGTTLAVKR